MHRLVAIAAATMHLVFVAFTLLGGFLAWLLPWVLVPHLASALWGARMLALRAACPLSVAENWGRSGAGRRPLDEHGFIAHYFEGRLYPSGWTRRIELLAGAIVVGSWLGYAVH